MRPLSACKACRYRRKKCIRVRQAMSCEHCVSRGLDCSPPEELKPASADKWYAPLGPAKSGEQRAPISPAMDPDAAFVEEIVDLFFRYYHVSLPSMFHRTTFKQAARNKTIPKILFFGIAALAARYSSHSSVAHLPPWDRGKPYAREAERLLNLHDTSLVSIQACVLLGISAQTLGEPDTESNFYALAYRMALILDLPNAAASSPLEKEIQIRVWWSLLSLDTWNSSALCIPRTIKWRDDIPLPTDEYTFLHGSQFQPRSPGSSETGSQASPVPVPTPPEHDSSFSVLGHKVKLNLLLYEVIKLNMAVVAGEICAYDLRQTVERFATSLNEWFHDLPSEWHYNEENLEHWNRLDMARLFMSVHIDYNNACQLLHFQFLYLSQDPGLSHNAGMRYETTCQLAERCKHHAGNICQLIYDTKEYPGAESLHALLGHVVCIASAVQLHILLFSSDEARISTARARLENNFTYLTRLHRYWPGIAAAFSRLEAFHDACLRSQDSSFRMDTWMLHFIVDWSRPVAHKSAATEVSDKGGIWSLNRLKNVLLEAT